VIILSFGLLQTSNALNINDGKLSGDAYISNNKVVFGNQNTVSFSYPKSMTAPIKISTGNLSNRSNISSLDYGANEIWYDGGDGAQDISTGNLYPGVINQTKNIGISILRYPGGIPSDTYHWQNAIGAQSSRTNNVIYQEQDVFLPSNFGPDEFGELLQNSNSVGDITVNFGTGTAQEAANWVSYMTAPTSNPWGELRAKNGHPAPYIVPIWEVGNETQSKSGENYWRSGKVVSVGSNNYECNSTDIHLCEYVYGGVTEFDNQKALAANNNLVSNGSNNQVFFAKYPPVVSSSQTVYVNGLAWRQVSSFSGVPANAKAYVLDNKTGQISFGGGNQGEALPKNAEVTISYKSGPHDGFIQYYNLMKVADPKIQICSSYQAVDFIQLMGSKIPYDCLATHLYSQQILSTNNSASLFHNSIIQQSNNFGQTLNNLKSAIKQYAGSRTSSISLDVTEYGVNAYTSPEGQPNYHRSQDIALFVANTLRVMIDEHISVAEKHFLISYQNSPAPGYQTFINGSTFSNNALLGGPGPNPIPQPSAYVIEAYSKLLYSNLISSSIKNNPNTIFSGGSYPNLATVATIDNKGDESLMVMNFSENQSIKAEVQPAVNYYKKVSSWTLGANSNLAYNTTSDPNVVSLINKNASLSQGKLIADFPPSSVTVLQMSK
jgi:alpha-N-arabinofuranosidase